MALTTRFVSILCILALFCLTSIACCAPSDDTALSVLINVELRDVSMPVAAAMVAKAADISVIAPGEPVKGIMMAMNNQSVRQVLDALSRATGMSWSMQDGMVVFAKPPETAPEAVKPTDTVKPLTPTQGMSLMMGSLSVSQFSALSSGRPMGYADMTAFQRNVLAGILSAPNIGMDDDGETVANLPPFDRVTVWFVTLPYLTVPGVSGQGNSQIRLDSTGYITLQGGEK